MCYTPGLILGQDTQNHMSLQTEVSANHDRMVQNFAGGNFDVFDAFQLDHQNLTRQII